MKHWKRREKNQRKKFSFQNKSDQIVNPFAKRRLNQAKLNEDGSKPFKMSSFEEQKERNDQSRSPYKAIPSNLNVVSRLNEDAEYRRKSRIVQQGRGYDSVKKVSNENKRKNQLLYSQKTQESHD